ncbi:MAG: DoxX family protein [Pyrinomonadaceae bacterium]
MFDAQDKNAWALLPLRLIVGFGFAAHGYAKLSKGVDGFAEILQTIGVPAPVLIAWATTLVEIIGGLAILAGAFVPLVSIPLIVVMLAAMLTVHLPFGFSSVKLVAMTADGARFGTIGYEVNLLYITCLLTLALSGASPWSVDAIRERRRKQMGRPRP